MARKPNYNFERQERDRRKAEKKADKLDRVKAEQDGSLPTDGPIDGSDDTAEPE